MSRGADSIAVRIGRLTIDQAALGGLSRAAYGERLQAEVARRLAGGAAAGGDATTGSVAERIARDVAATLPGRPPGGDGSDGAMR